MAAQQPRWLSRAVVDVIHQELIAEHGGAPGLRAGGGALIESALARPRNRFEYDDNCDLSDLASSYLYGLLENHGYVDGNKRVAFAAAATFLLLNGVRLTASEADAYGVVIGLATDEHSEAWVAQWMRDNCVAR